MTKDFKTIYFVLCSVRGTKLWVRYYFSVTSVLQYSVSVRMPLLQDQDFRKGELNASYLLNVCVCLLVSGECCGNCECCWNTMTLNIE